MPARRHANNPMSAARLALRRAGRERVVADMREGRRQRAVTIPSGKTYRRRPKHIGAVGE